MSRKHKSQSSSANTSLEEANKIAQGIKKSGQTKEQTKLVAQGIQKGIELYKSQQNAKNREMDKRRKQTLKEKEKSSTPEEPVQDVQIKQHWLPWVLLVLSWVGVGIYLAMF